MEKYFIIEHLWDGISLVTIVTVSSLRPASAASVQGGADWTTQKLNQPLNYFEQA